MADEEVALRKESVDRNFDYKYIVTLKCYVALRKESVDRNSSCTSRRADRSRSLSARRAWIEISGVMLRRLRVPRRSPQGERG